MGESCEHPVPRPIAYPRITFPPKEYQWYRDEVCPFRFRFPIYAQVNYDSVFFDTIPEDPCWVNLVIPDLNATWHLTLKSLQKYPLDLLVQQSHFLTYRHTQKAEYIREVPIQDSTRKLWGVLYMVGGDAASNIQFYLTDYEQWFVRGALYIRATPNEDSLLPVIRFLQADLDTLLASFQWKDRRLSGKRHERLMQSWTLEKTSPGTHAKDPKRSP